MLQPESLQKKHQKMAQTSIKNVDEFMEFFSGGFLGVELELIAGEDHLYF